MSHPLGTVLLPGLNKLVSWVIRCMVYTGDLSPPPGWLTLRPSTTTSPLIEPSTKFTLSKYWLRFTTSKRPDNRSSILKDNVSFISNCWQLYSKQSPYYMRIIFTKHINKTLLCFLMNNWMVYGVNGTLILHTN